MSVESSDDLDLVESYRLDTEFSERAARPAVPYVGGVLPVVVKEDWTNCEVIGYTPTSIVHKQLQNRTGRLRAVKIIYKHRLPTAFDYKRELLVMAILAEHEALFVKFLGWCEDTENVYIAMEYFAQGDLRKHLQTPLPEPVVRIITGQLLEGLQAMHESGITHRDLKPENIFVVSMSPIRIKLGDFGISKRVPAYGDTSLHTTICTRIYAAPEVLGIDLDRESSVYTNAVDIWSLGCVVYELLAGTRLFSEERQISRYFHGRWIFPVEILTQPPLHISDSAVSFIKAAVELDPEARPGAEEAQGHTWLAGLRAGYENGWGGAGYSYKYDSIKDLGESAQNQEDNGGFVKVDVTALIDSPGFIGPEKSCERLQGPNDSNTIGSAHELASMFHVQEKYNESEKVDPRALDGLSDALGANHPDTLRAFHSLADSLQGNKKHDKAERMYRRVLDGRKDALGLNHPDTLQSFHNLADSLQEQQKYNEAEEMYRCALDGRKDTLGPSHPDTLGSFHNLAASLQEQKRYDEAEEMYQCALDGRKDTLGPSHPDTLQSFHNLADSLQEQQKFSEAEKMYRRALDGRKDVLGPNHPRTLESFQNLAASLNEQKKYDEAEEMYLRALDGRMIL